MSTDLTVHTTSLADQMEFARIVVAQPDRGAQSILPESYRGNPANVLIAVGLGASMGLSPAESLYRISVIKGKPSAGAELIAANVRKAGHRLRVKGDETTCTATIVRADDPDYEFSITRDVAWARTMGLGSSDNYKKQPGTMFQWRAITAVARLACPEALYGVVYTSDELYDSSPRQVPTPATSGAERMRSALAPADVIDLGNVEVIADEIEPDTLTARTRGRLFALMAEQGIEDPAVQRSAMSKVLGREIASRSDLSEADAKRVVVSLEARAA